MKINIFKPTMLKKFLIAFLVVALIPLVIASYNSYRSAEEELKSSLNESYYLLMQHLVNLIDESYVGNWVKNLRALSNSVDYSQQLDDQSKMAILNSYLESTDQIIGILIKSSDGNISNLFKQDQIMELYDMDAESVTKFFRFSNETRTPINILKPIIFEKGNSAFLPIEVLLEWQNADTTILRAIFSLDEIMREIPEVADVGRRELYILDSSARIIFANKNARFKAGEIFKYPVISENIINALSGGTRASQIEAFEYQDEKYIGNFSVSKYIGWAIVLVERYTWAYALVMEMKKNTIVWIGIAAILSIFFSIFFARYFSRSIKYLAGVSNRIGEGEFDITVKTPGKDELGDLASSLQEMAVHLKESVKMREELAAIQHEIKIASKIQQSILPEKIPDIKGLNIHARYIPMAGVAGDFYDFHEISETEVGILIADVSGHGIPAALISSMVKITFSLQSPHAKIPEIVLKSMNSTLTGKIEDQFLSASYMYLDVRKMHFSIADAGHLPLLIWRRSENKLYQVKPKGMLIGWVDDVEFPTEEFDIEPGDRLVLYTDGIIEAPSPSGECYGVKRFVELIKNNLDKDGNDFINIIVDTLSEWSQVKESFEDDLTLIIVDIENV